jgi:KDO2-lipid IV(A) lauroyltransferase
MFLRVRHLAEYLVVRLIVCVLQSMSLSTCARFARRMARLLTDVVPVRVREVDDNLRRAFPAWTAEQRTNCRRKMWEHLFLFIAEIAQAPRKIRISNYRRHIDFRQRDVFCRSMFDDRGVIFVTAHFGVFEMLGYNCGLTGFPNHSIARTLDNPYLEEFVRTFRGATGQHLIAKDGASDQMLAVLAGGGIIGILADQYAGTKGCWVEFFGHPASAHKAIALLALANDVPLVVVSCRRTSGPLHFEQRAHAVFDPRTAPPEMHNVKAITQWFTTEFEKFIAETPEQYWWLHRRWKDNRPARKKAREAAAAQAA